MHFFHELVIFWSAQKCCRCFFSTLHPLSLVIFATAIVVAFVLLRNSRFNFHCYTQREAMPTQNWARKWHCNLSWLLVWKITKGIHSCKPASLNRPIRVLLQIRYIAGLKVKHNFFSGFVLPLTEMLHITLKTDHDHVTNGQMTNSNAKIYGIDKILCDRRIFQSRFYCFIFF